MARTSSSAVTLAGIDGCRGGWIVARGHVATPVSDAPAFASIELFAVPKLAEAIGLRGKAKHIALDMPVGLPEMQEPGGRECDREARKILGRPRLSSVFSAPRRGLLQAVDYDEVRTKGLTRQAFHLLPKIREADQLMTPALQRRIRETHPELVFCALAGSPMRLNKKTAEGRRERTLALRKCSPILAGAAASPPVYRNNLTTAGPRAAPDDVIDALALLAGAFRQWTGQAVRLPTNPPRDARGLRMEIWY